MRSRRATLRPGGPEIALHAGDVATRADRAAMELFYRHQALGDVLERSRRIEMTTSGRLVIVPTRIPGEPAPAIQWFGCMSRSWAEERLAELKGGEP